MAFVGRGASKSGLWQALKRAAFVESGVAQKKSVWGSASLPLPPLAPPRATLRRELVPDVCPNAASVVENVTEGLSNLLALCHRRVDARIILRSFHSGTTFASAPVVAGVKSSQFGGIARGSDSCATSVFAIGGRRSLMHTVETGNNFGSSTSLKMKIQPQPSCRSTVVTRRSLSLETWTERWNASTEKFKNVINMKPKTATTVGSRAGVKIPGVQGRTREILSDVSKPVQRTLSHYREAVGLQLEGFWKRNYLLVVGIVGLGVCLLLWRLMFGIASTFISMSEGLAKFGFLALAAAMVILSGVVMRARFTINPDAVYRVAMRKLNTSAAVLEVMGAPLTGSDLRAYIMSGGGFRLKNFRPRLAGKRCFVIFPIQGSERRGLVSIEVKKKKGQYDFKLLAVDVPTAGDDQRLYLIGDEREYKVGGGLISELRDPMVKAMAAQKEFEELDMREEEAEQEELEKQAMEAENLRAEELIKLKIRQQQEESENLVEPKMKESKPSSAHA